MGIVRRSAFKWKNTTFAKGARESIYKQQGTLDEVGLLEAFTEKGTQFDNFLEKWEAEIVSHEGGKEFLKIVVEPTFV